MSDNGLVFVGIPRERCVLPEFMDNWLAVMGRLDQTGRYCGCMFQSGHRVDHNRDRIVANYLRHPREPEWLLFLDSDMEHPKDLGERLLRWDKKLIGGLYFFRSDRFQPEVFRFLDSSPDRWGRDHYGWAAMDEAVYDWLVENDVNLDGAMTVEECTDPLLPCDAVATGAMLIHRSILAQMTPPWFEYPHGWSSEDVEFCKRARDEQGIQCYVDLSTISGHYMTLPVSAATFRMMHERGAR